LSQLRRSRIGRRGGACEFCGTALNDGQHGWVLEETAGFADPRARRYWLPFKSTTAGWHGSARIGAVLCRKSRQREWRSSSRSGSLGLLVLAIKVAYADGHLDDSERRMLTQFAGPATFPRSASTSC